MSHGFSKKNQSSIESSYRFTDFELHPRERLLKRSDVPIPLQPKAFEALLCLVRNAGHLVTKTELMDTLWPSVHVSEANLTNTIVSLRKIVGRDGIETVSKHGYRFGLPVTGEPGVARSTYEKFARAKELTVQRSLESMGLARELYWTCLAENPSFAPAWAWLGRCCWFLAKFSSAASANVGLAEAAFRRAFTLDPDLACAHQFYTYVQVDSGHSGEAMTRLLDRLQRHPFESESYAGLVQVLRFRGLLAQSVEAHKQATALDPAVVTSVAHTLFLRGEYAATIEAYSGRAAYYLDAAAWAALGEKNRAIALLRSRLDKMPLSKLMGALLSSLLALLEGNSGQAIRDMDSADTVGEPEILIYFARQYAQAGQPDQAVLALKRAFQCGFVCAPETLRSDGWLGTIRDRSEFKSVLADAEAQVSQALASVTNTLACAWPYDPVE